MGYIITSCNIQVEKTRISILYFFVDITILYKFSISIVENQSVWRIQTKVIKNGLWIIISRQPFLDKHSF